MYVEMSTYRYHGHSMSDPGTTYRNRDEIAAMRSTRDPIEHVKKLLTDHTDATEEELKAIEKGIRAEVADACARAKAGAPLQCSEVSGKGYQTAAHFGGDAASTESLLQFCRRRRGRDLHLVALLAVVGRRAGGAGAAPLALALPLRVAAPGPASGRGPAGLGPRATFLHRGACCC